MEADSSINQIWGKITLIKCKSKEVVNYFFWITKDSLRFILMKSKCIRPSAGAQCALCRGRLLNQAANNTYINFFGEPTLILVPVKMSWLQERTCF